MIPRVIEPRLRAAARTFPIVTITGPRQSGKTTLCRAVFPEKPYVSLEAPDMREYAIRDPRGFLADHRDGAVLDEIHRAPGILSYLQTIIDEDPGARGRFILTGSANFSLLASLGQSLAGRTALLELLPLSLAELRRFAHPPTDLWEVVWRGTYPAIYDRDIPPRDWYPSYTATYLERDVRAILNVGDLLAFQTFLRLSAGRVAQLLNLSGLGADAGITHVTAKSWLSVLEAGYVAWRLPPLHANVGKRLIKTPKLHFVDPGLACSLLGILGPDQLRQHPLRGPLFETWVASEILKCRAHRGLSGGMLFHRDRAGKEVDILVETGGPTLIAVETKSGRTVAQDFFSGLESLRALLTSAQPPRDVRPLVVYAGDTPQRRGAGRVVPWTDIDRCEWWG